MLLSGLALGDRHQRHDQHGIRGVLDIVLVGASSDFTEGTQYTILATNMPYGVAHRFIAGKNGELQKAGPQGTNSTSLLARYD